MAKSRSDIKELETVYEFQITPIKALKATILDIAGREYFDIRFYETFHKGDGSEMTYSKKGICVHKDLLPEFKQAVMNIEKWLETGSIVDEEAIIPVRSAKKIPE